MKKKQIKTVDRFIESDRKLGLIEDIKFKVDFIHGFFIGLSILFFIGLIILVISLL